MKQNRQRQTLKALLGLRDLVLGGAFAPGDRLSEVVLAKRLGISRTPLRAALARLEQEGLLEQIPSGGYAARGFRLSEVYDAIELRGVMEGTAARIAAERGVEPARLSAIKTLVAELDKTIRDRPQDILFDRYVALNASFHAALAGLAGSELLRREVERSTLLPFASPSAFLDRQEAVPAFWRSLGRAQQHHRDIVEAIERREGARAEALAREHARLARQNLDFVVNQDRSLMVRLPSLALVSG